MSTYEQLQSVAQSVNEHSAVTKAMLMRASFLIFDQPGEAKSLYDQVSRFVVMSVVVGGVGFVVCLLFVCLLFLFVFLFVVDVVVAIFLLLLSFSLTRFLNYASD